jgi:hypothetical protein
MRGTAEDYKNSEIYLKQQALIETQVREFRESLGLPVQEPGKHGPLP